MEEQSNLQVAVSTPVEELTDEQKQLLKENVAALTDEEKEKFASVLGEAAAPSGDTPPAGDQEDV